MGLFEFPRSNLRPRGFTLIELMISIALVLVLILGVNQVFQYTTQAVGAGEAINSAIRSSRAAEATFAGDLGNMVSPGTGPTDSACLIISSMQAYAYRNKADLAAEGTVVNSGLVGQGATGYPAGAPYQDFANTGKFGDSSVPGDVTYPYTYNSRNHRLDVLSFFARDLFHRQTGNAGTFVDNMAGTEAWVWYGHLQLPDNGGYDKSLDFPHNIGGNDTFPCAGQSPATNPNNFFAGQLVLGRVATVLVPATGDIIKDTAGNQQWFLDSKIGIDPLAVYSQVNPAPASGGTESATYYLPDSRVDLANTSIAIFRSTLEYAISKGGASFNWWDLMMDGNPSYINNQQYTRFKCNPFVPKPMQAVNMAMASPYFLGGCSQFTVEYAGDYLNQDNNPASTTYGSLINVRGSSGYYTQQPDGQIDYQIITDPNTRLQRKQIIWYGLPRNTSGIVTYGSSGKPSCSIANGDVAPLNYWLTQVAGVTNPYSFEKNPPNLGSDLTSMPNGTQYICAWGPNDKKPKLIRITLTLDDPTGRLPDGQTYQYVFAVP